MAGKISVDYDWIKGYAGTVADAGNKLGSAASTVAANPLSAQSFGELGATVGSANAYAAAAQMLQQQLARAAQALTAASGQLTQLVNQHSSADAEQAAAMRKIHNQYWSS